MPENGNPSVVSYRIQFAPQGWQVVRSINCGRWTWESIVRTVRDEAEARCWMAQFVTAFLHHQEQIREIAKWN